MMVGTWLETMENKITISAYSVGIQDKISSVLFFIIFGYNGDALILECCRASVKFFKITFNFPWFVYYALSVV